MITSADFYHVMTAVVPLYVAMILAYGSVKWWKIFTPDQCSGINRFVAIFAVPLLSFHSIASNDPSAINLRFIAADTLQKLIVLGILALWTNLTKTGCLKWTITLFSLSSCPNTLVIGIPLLKGMYGDFSAGLMVQILVLQYIIWNTLLLFMLEYRASKMLISEQFIDTANSIGSIHVDSDAMSSDGRHPLETEAEDGELHVNVRKSNTSRSDSFSRRSMGFSSKDDGRDEGGKDLHMFVGSSSDCPVSDVFGGHAYDALDQHANAEDVGGADSPVEGLIENQDDYNLQRDGFSFGNRENGGEEVGENQVKVVVPASVVTRLILIMVWRKLKRNPNNYSSLIGLIWSLVSFRWHIEMPAIIAKSISILSDASLGMAMFSLGLFMALLPMTRTRGSAVVIAFAMAVRLLTGPAVMAAASVAVGLRGDILRIAIVQAALPQGIVAFVLAKEYNVHPVILAMGVIFGMLIGLPVTLVYYILLGL